MAITNAEIARMFNEYANLLEIKGENPFKVRAYRNAARVVENIGKPLEELVKEGFDLTKLPGIGADLSQYIKEIVTTGRFSKLDEIKDEIPPSLLELLKIEGLGPKRIRTLYDRLRIQSLEDLRRAAENGEIATLSGFGPTLIERIKKGVVLAKKAGQRFKWSEAKEYVEDILNYLSTVELTHLQVAGSFRRKKETVGDIDILATAKDFSQVVRHFLNYPKIKEVISAGATRSTVILTNDMQVDLRSVDDDSYGSALQYFTGSKSHNIEVRKLAIEKGLKLNEYGVFKGDKKIAGKTEEEVYEAVGLCFIEPELRENRGEIEACLSKSLPKLVELEDIRGDLHTHTLYTDGKNSIEEMARAAQQKGYEYLAITDHSKRLSVARGLDEKRALKELEEIDRVNEKVDGITLLKGMEVDILEDGSLDMSDEVLKELDIVLIAVHYKFNLSKQKQTERILKAFENPYVNILAHPTGRMIGLREPMELDMHMILKRAKEYNIHMEINAQPERLDLNDIYAKMAKEMGVKMAVNTDAHNIYSLNYMEYGINQARRGWCEKEDIVNTRDLKGLRELLKR